MIKNIEKIHIVKRNKVLHGLQFIEKCCREVKYVDKVIIFGSAVRDDCTEESDIDICLFTDYTCKNRGYFKIRSSLCDTMNDNCDILEFSLCDSRFQKIMLETGVIVYE